MTISSSERTGDAGRTDSPDGGTYLVSGMSLRDWFAGQALAACIQKCVPQECNTGENMEQMFARKAFLVADAMLATRTAAKGSQP